MCLFLGLQIYNHHIYLWIFFLRFKYGIYLMFLTGVVYSLLSSVCWQAVLIALG
jgi:hypothetical protein